ncbi:hypothetical protein [Falsiroseomonas sp.]|uniref:hypothetical protein n=1 Tax=Falsiroseomonas sp. TaxID=2870721 RepID=UPI00356B3469
MRALLLALALAAASVPAGAQAPEPRSQADRLLGIFVDKGASAFLDAVLAETPLGEDAGARRAIEENRPRWLRNLEGMGVVVDFEFAGERRYAPSLKTLCYVVRHRRVPLLFAFRFYRGPQQWELLNYAWHSQDRVTNWECASGELVAAP